MPLQVALLVGAVGAVSTLVRLFAGVDSDVPLQIYLLYSAVGTVRAGKGLLPCVRAQVSRITDGNVSTVPTDWALIQLVSGGGALPQVLGSNPCIVHIHLLGILVLLMTSSELLFNKYISRNFKYKVST